MVKAKHTGTRIALLAGRTQLVLTEGIAKAFGVIPVSVLLTALRESTLPTIGTLPQEKP